MPQVDNPIVSVPLPIEGQTLGDGHCVACNAKLGRIPWVRSNEIALYRCNACGSLTCCPRPNAVQLARFHDTEEYFAHPYFQLRRNNFSAIERRCRAVFESLRPHIAGAGWPSVARHLDVGCDTGLFLLAANRIFATVPIGVDVSTRAIEQTRARGVEAYLGPIEFAPATVRDLDIVTAMDVIEHVSEPRSFLGAIATRLRSGGLLYIETPNADSIVYRIGRAIGNLTGGKPVWLLTRLFPREHVQYLTRPGFDAMLRGSGLTVVSATSRPLMPYEIATSLPIRIAMVLLQQFDRLTGQMIQHCAIMRRI